MTTHDDLICENKELRARLALAEMWMRREVQHAITSVARDNLRRHTRKHFENMFETEGIDIMTARIMQAFGDVLHTAPAHTLERLIDAEIYYETLQRYPHMDALPIVLAYQKIIDAWIEERVTAPFRRGGLGFLPSGQRLSGLDGDIVNIIEKNYTLSFGRLYQILAAIREKKSFSPVAAHFTAYLDTYEGGALITRLISDDIFYPLSRLIELEVFSKKRHEKKVSFADAKETREILCGERDGFSMLKALLQSGV